MEHLFVFTVLITLVLFSFRPPVQTEKIDTRLSKVKQGE